jgi:hypothetical protein
MKRNKKSPATQSRAVGLFFFYIKLLYTKAIANIVKMNKPIMPISSKAFSTLLIRDGLGSVKCSSHDEYAEININAIYKSNEIKKTVFITTFL